MNSRTSISQRFLLILAVLLPAVVLFFNLGLQDVVNVNEGQRLEPAREMVETGDWVVPRIAGKPYIKKPPLIYWIVGAVFRAAGRHDKLLGRVPVTLCAVLTAWLLIWVARRHGRPRVGLWASIILATGYYYQETAQEALIDPLLAFALTLGVYGLYVGLGREARRPWLWLTLAALCFGAGGLLKGPVVFPFLATALAAAAWVERPPWPRILGATGLIVAAVILCFAPWAWALVTHLGWAETWEVFHGESLERTVTASRINSGPPWYYLLHAGAGCLPWALLAFVFVARKARESLGRAGSFFRFSVWYVIGATILFSLFSGKETEYILPVFPYFALVCGVAFEWLLTAPPDARGSRLLSLRVWYGLAILLTLTPILLLTPAREWFTGHPLLGAILIPGAVSSALAAWAMRRPERRLGAAVLFIVAVAALSVAIRDGRRLRENLKRSPRPAAELAARLAREGTSVWRYRLRQAHEVWYLRGVAPYLDEEKDLRRRFEAGPHRAVLVLQSNKIDKLEKKFGPVARIETLDAKIPERYMVARLISGPSPDSDRQ